MYTVQLVTPRTQDGVGTLPFIDNTWSRNLSTLSNNVHILLTLPSIALRVPMCSWYRMDGRLGGVSIVHLQDGIMKTKDEVYTCTHSTSPSVFSGWL